MSWRADAACRLLIDEGRADREWWFPPPFPPGRRSDAHLSDDMLAAMRVCAFCPVAADCLSDAMRYREYEDAVTIRGGLTAGERNSVRRGRITLEQVQLRAAERIARQVA